MQPFTTVPPDFLQPSYPTVMPIWTTESNDKFLIDLITDLNMADGGAAGTTHPVS